MILLKIKREGEGDIRNFIKTIVVLLLIIISIPACSVKSDQNNSGSSNGGDGDLTESAIQNWVALVNNNSHFDLEDFSRFTIFANGDLIFGGTVTLEDNTLTLHKAKSDTEMVYKTTITITNTFTPKTTTFPIYDVLLIQ